MHYTGRQIFWPHEQNEQDRSGDFSCPFSFYGRDRVHEAGSTR
jgi:hypothetical protein